MPGRESIKQWLGRICAGHSQAASDLVNELSPTIHRIVKIKLSQDNLRHLIDYQDICQATFGSFFSRLCPNWPPVSTIDQLTALLATIAKNKIRDEVRRLTAERRDHRRLSKGRVEEQLELIATNAPSPVHDLAWKELYNRVIELVSEEEHRLLLARLSGRSWHSIAAEFDSPATVVRQKFTRALQRIRRCLVHKAENYRNARVDD